ncbi:MAG: carboxypeptidase-like regulatory domain-containing protein [Bryobacteraceae bacterium]
MMQLVVLFCLLATSLGAQPGRRPPTRGPQSRTSPQANTATSATRPEDLAALTGSVRDKSTGEPLRKATITLYSLNARAASRGPARPATTTTDAAGNYVFTGIEPGRYRLSARRNGYVPRSFGAGSSGTPVTLAPAQKLGSIDFQLVPHAVVTGRVDDEDGDPVVHASVQLFRYVYTDRGKTLRTAGAAQTNDLGEYRIFGVGPGKYYLQAAYRRGPVDTGPARPGEADEDYVPVYYPAATSIESATPIEIAAGAAARGVDVRLSKARTYRVAGRVTGGPSEGRPGSVMLLRRATPGAGYFEEQRFGGRGSSWNSRTGAFEIRNITPGSYTLIARSDRGREERWSASVPIEIGNADLTGLDLALQLSQPVTGAVRIEGESTVDLSRLRIAFADPGGRGGASGGYGEVDAEGRFEVRGAGAGAFDVNIFPMPAGHYLKAVKMGERQLDGNTLDLPGGAPMSGIEIVLSATAATIEGVAVDRRGEPAAGASMLILPPANDPQRDRRQFRATADQNGHFQISGIPPGDYRVYAFTGAEDGEDRDPDLIAKFESDSEKITLKDSAREAKQVKAIALDQ